MLRTFFVLLCTSEVTNYSKLLLLQAIRVFLLMRDLCLALLGKNEEHLPLSKVENSVHLEDVLDLSKWKVPFFFVHLLFFNLLVWLVLTKLYVYTKCERPLNFTLWELFVEMHSDGIEAFYDRRHEVFPMDK